MGFRAHILRHVKFRELDDKQRAAMKEELEKHKKELQAAIKAVDRGLRELKKKRK